MNIVITSRFRYNLTTDVRGCHVYLLNLYMNVTRDEGVDHRALLTHHHSHTELQYVLDGHARMVCGDETYRLEPGHLFFVPPNVPHRLILDEPVTRLMITFQLYAPAEDSQDARQFYAALCPDTAASLTVEEDGELRRILDDLIGQHLWEDRPDPLLHDKLRARMVLLLYALHDALPSPRAGRGESQPSHVTRQQIYLEDHFERNCINNNRAGLLAKRMHVSTRQLSRTLKSNFGMNYRQKLNATRLEVARQMLQDTDLSVARVAESLGYSSSTTFGTFIRNQTGLSPTQLRRALRDETEG